MDDQLMNIVAVLEELREDDTVPRNIKSKVEEISKVLQGDEDDIKIKVDKALHLLDEIADDSNLKSYTRSQIWNLVSMLESM